MVVWWGGSAEEIRPPVQAGRKAACGAYARVVRVARACVQVGGGSARGSRQVRAGCVQCKPRSKGRRAAVPREERGRAEVRRKCHVGAAAAHTRAPEEARKPAAAQSAKSVCHLLLLPCRAVVLLPSFLLIRSVCRKKSPQAGNARQHGVVGGCGEIAW